MARHYFISSAVELLKDKLKSMYAYRDDLAAEIANHQVTLADRQSAADSNAKLIADVEAAIAKLEGRGG